MGYSLVSILLTGQSNIAGCFNESFALVDLHFMFNVAYYSSNFFVILFKLT